MQREHHLALSCRAVRICCVNKLLKAASSCSGGRARAEAACGLVNVWSALLIVKSWWLHTHTTLEMCFPCVSVLVSPFVECAGSLLSFLTVSPLYLLCKVYTLEMFEGCWHCMTGILNCALAMATLHGWSQNAVSLRTKNVYVCGRKKRWERWESISSYQLRLVKAVESRLRCPL